ncbi:thiamine biosynthesis protein ThiF [Sulfurimonas sp.]|uniref:thiamine biosynthesis protein ThiF n=1 Tax=Sulfurimonas sp. TaxID=2022749 RepID=UPI002627BBDB|nr:thiamine biosynthesis protein ThiF [Sulfurimonas sp.]MCW8895944.1 thiamine biosynthesis protein ThiF [Sulfurimonas sp.]MCW9068068.1 thiamine biosynthesis protein ThiF [Sulfurimonas sp.]
MIHGFNQINDFDESLTCEGIIGDGCGGGRIFTIQNGTLKAYDPQSEEVVVLLEGIVGAKSISKKACTLFIECEDEKFEFDLPTLSKIVK